MSNHALSTAGRFPVRRKRPNRPAVDNASRFVASAEWGPVHTIDYGYGPLDQVATVKNKRGVVTTTTFGTATLGCDFLNRPKETRISALSGALNVLLQSNCWNANATLNSYRAYLDASRYRETRLIYDAGSNGLNVAQEQIVGMPSGLTVTRTYIYDSLGRKRTETLKRRASPTNPALVDLTTTYEYDALDRITKLTDALGNEVINNYDANGQLWKVTHNYKKPDATFEVRDIVTRSFDAADRVKTETDADGNVTAFTYDEAGNVIAVLDAEGHTKRYEYDAMNRRTAVVDATGFRNTTGYTLRGDVVVLTNPNGETVKLEIDPLGRKTAVVDARGFRSEFRYDENGNLTCTIDTNAQAGLQPKNLGGCTESRQYDELNRVSRITDALNGETRFSYDLLGNRLTVQDAENKTWSFAYDDLGRLAIETDHAGKSISYKADEAGNVFERTNRLLELTRYTFDNGNRLNRVDYLKDATAETFGYDPAGNRNAATNGNVGYVFSWDRLNRLTGKTDSRGRSLAFTYDKVGNILTKTTYQGSTTRYLYNAANRLVQLSNPDYLQVDYQYDPAGRLLSRVTSAGARTGFDYDANGALTRLTQYDAANALISDTSYTRDRLGNILTQSDPAGLTTYVYDALYRLKSADYPGTANDEAFAYDKVGNRKLYTKGSLVPGAATRYYTYATGTNRLADIRIGSATGTIESVFTHDFEGRLSGQTGVGAKTLSWDAKGRLNSLGTETYNYDPMDYRIGRSGGGLGNRSYFLEGEHLESEYSGTNLLGKYFRGSSTDELVAGYLNDTDGKLKPFLFHHDALTSTTAVTGHSGGAIERLQYAAFGATQSSAGISPSRLKYTGREDDGTGLYYYRARYYDPTIGRFVSEDPLGFAAGDVNFYHYVKNNPTNANDPSGLVDVVYRSGSSLGSLTNMVSRGLNFYVADGQGGRYPMGDGVFQRTVLAGRAFGQVFDPPQTNALVNWGQTHIQNNRLNGATGGASLSEIASQSGEGKPWDTKQFLPSTGVYVINGKAELRDYVGNAIWGAAVKSLGATESVARAGAHAQSLWANGTLDDPRDQEAIHFGYSLPLSPLPGTPVTPAYQGGGGSSVEPSLKLDSNFGPTSGIGGAANGGFLLYPNKSNTNMMRSVYSK